MKTFEGRTAVITGAGSGFGLELARIAAARKMKLVLADVQADALERARGELSDQGAEVLALVTDVSKAADVEALSVATRERFGVPHLLFNNAGVAVGGLVWEASLKDWEWVLGVNLWGVIHGIHAFVPSMVAASMSDPSYEGHVINTASMAGVVSIPSGGVYGASKHAVVTLTETLYQDLTLVGARVGATVLCPFYVPTAIHGSERNRPAQQKNDTAPTVSQLITSAMVEKAVKGGKVTAAQVAAMTFDAIVNDKVYVFSHPQALAGVKARMEDVVAQSNPRDPLADRPEVREGLKRALRDAAAQGKG